MDIIGFIISLFALVYLFFKQRSLEQQNQENEWEDKDERAIEKVMKAKERERVARERAQHVPPPLPKVKKFKQPLASPLEEYRIKSQLETRHLKSAIAPSHHLGEKKKKGLTQVELAVRRLSCRRDLIIYQEIIGKPKSLRPDP